MDHLFAEGAGARRRFLDRLVLALEPGHARVASRYETALRERNRLLEAPGEPDPLWLDGIEAGLAEAGAEIARARAELIAGLAGALEALPEAPFARPALAYAAGGPVAADALREALREGRRRDSASGRTLVGPHRDDLAVTLAAKQAPAADCSTGEQKAMLISIVLAHAALTAGARPQLLLLDEIAAHLDPVRRAALYERLGESGAQVWMTGTELAPFDGLGADSAVWRVADGAVVRG
jgi:DNA replication and repair protein RecF